MADIENNTTQAQRMDASAKTRNAVRSTKYEI